MPEVTSRTLPSGKEVQRLISPEAVKVYETIRNTPKQVDLDLFHQREAGEHQEDMTSEPQGVTYEEAPQVGGLWATPQTGDGNSAIMYLYGGGYVISSPHSRRKTAGHLANASGARVLVPRYELGPEHPFPAAVDDAADDYRWLLDQGFRTGRAVIAGDSSGGGLTIATMLKLRDDGTPLPAGGVSLPLGRSGLHGRDARHARQRGSHGHQAKPAAHGGPVPPRRRSPHAARLPTACRPLWLAAPPDRRRGR